MRHLYFIASIALTALFTFPVSAEDNPVCGEGGPITKAIKAEHKKEIKDRVAPPALWGEAIAQDIVAHAWNKSGRPKEFKDLYGNFKTEESILGAVLLIMNAKQDDEINLAGGKRKVHSLAYDEGKRRGWWVQIKGSNGLLVIYNPYGEDCGSAYPSTSSTYKSVVGIKDK